MHSQVLPWGNSHQNGLDIGDVLDINWDRKSLPVKNITKRRHIALGYQNRHTF